MPLVLFLFERNGRKTAEKALETERGARLADQEKRAHAERLARARRVVGWFEFRQGGQTGSNGAGETFFTGVDVCGVVHNTSDEPAFKVTLFYLARPEPSEGLDPDPSEPDLVLGVHTWPVIPPREHRETLVPGLATTDVRSYVEYWDADGTRWRRFPLGLVIENAHPVPG